MISKNTSVHPYINFGYYPLRHWEKVDSVEKNVRYLDAKEKSTAYLPQIMKFIK